MNRGRRIDPKLLNLKRVRNQRLRILQRGLQFSIWVVLQQVISLDLARFKKLVQVTWLSCRSNRRCLQASEFLSRKEPNLLLTEKEPWEQEKRPILRFIVQSSLNHQVWTSVSLQNNQASQRNLKNEKKLKKNRPSHSSSSLSRCQSFLKSSWINLTRNNCRLYSNNSSIWWCYNSRTSNRTKK